MTMHGDKPIFSQSQEGATLEPYEPTFREKTEAVIRDLLTQYGGLSRGGARNIAQGITGTTDPSQGIMDSLGVLDFLGGGLIFGPQEIKRDFERAQSGVDYIAPTVGGVLTVAESLPFLNVVGKPVSRSVKGFLSNLSKKSAIEESVDMSRRNVLSGMVAAPVVAGALSEIPINKIIETPPVAKEVVQGSAPRLFTSATFKNFDEQLSFATDLWKAKTGETISKKELLEKDMAEYLNFFENDDLYHESANKFSKGANTDILDTFDLEGQVKDDVDDVMNKYLGGDSDEFGYGGGSDDLTTEAFLSENPSFRDTDFDENDVIDWIISKGIDKKPYYKKLAKDKNATQQDMIEYAMQRAEEERKKKGK